MRPAPHCRVLPPSSGFPAICNLGNSTRVEELLAKARRAAILIYLFNNLRETQQTEEPVTLPLLSVRAPHTAAQPLVTKGLRAGELTIANVRVQSAHSITCAIIAYS